MFVVLEAPMRKGPGTLRDKHGVIHRRCYNAAPYSRCLRQDEGPPDDVMLFAKTKDPVVTCLWCLRTGGE